MLEIIHENRKRVYKANLKKEKKESKKNIVVIAVAIITTLIVIVAGIRYNEKQVNACIEAGNNETFCRLAGE